MFEFLTTHHNLQWKTVLGCTRHGPLSFVMCQRIHIINVFQYLWCIYFIYVYLDVHTCHVCIIMHVYIYIYTLYTFIDMHTCKVICSILISQHAALLDAYIIIRKYHLLFVSLSSKDLFAEVRRVLHHEAENCSPKELTQITWATRTSSAQIACPERRWYGVVSFSENHNC